jgi:hypothetical protein
MNDDEIIFLAKGRIREDGDPTSGVFTSAKLIS